MRHYRVRWGPGAAKDGYVVERWRGWWGLSLGWWERDLHGQVFDALVRAVGAIGYDAQVSGVSDSRVLVQVQFGEEERWEELWERLRPWRTDPRSGPADASEKEDARISTS